MHILAGMQQLPWGGDSGAYLVTVCEHLERLGHEATVFAEDVEERPAGSEVRIVTAERGLPLAPDVIYAQDAYAALLLSELYPLTPQVFALHGDRDELWLPPQLAGVTARVVAFDDRALDRARAASLPQELVRLSLPVDTDRFSPRGPLGDRPQRALLALEGLSDYRRGVAQRACADAGVEVVEQGHADLSVGRGRKTLEAMASGMAAYVYGDDGGDGWVTPERYELLEADGFSGRAEATATDFERLRRDLDEYDPTMGPANRELSLAHSARSHAQELVGIFSELAPRRDPVDAPLRELARLVRVEAASARRAEAASAEAWAANARIQQLEGELAEAQEGTEALSERVARLEQALRDAEDREREAAAQRTRGVRSLLPRERKPPSTET